MTMPRAETCELKKEYLGHRALVPFDVAAEFERDLRELASLARIMFFEKEFFDSSHEEQMKAIAEKWRV